MASQSSWAGRLILPPDVENSMVDLLMEWRDPKQPLVPKASDSPSEQEVLEAKVVNDSDNEHQEQNSKTSKPSSESHHHKAHLRRKFVKQLVAATTHEPNASLSRPWNQGFQTMSTQEQRNAKSMNRPYLSSLSARVEFKETNISTSMYPLPAKDKVRVNVREAIYKGRTDCSNWTPGCIEKTIILDRCSNSQTILQLAKDKLKLKKKPIRCFYVLDNVEYDLENHLDGIPAELTLYVTSQQVVKHEHSEINQHDNHDKIEMKYQTDSSADPLVLVKKMYTRQQNKTFPQHRELGQLVLHMDRLHQLPTLPPFRAQLPVANFRQDVLSAIAQSRILILCGETGCGKSTQIPQYVLEEMQTVGFDGNIVVTQPRRVAAAALAQRVAFERAESVGMTVGYQIRLENAISESTRITYMTIGILLRKLTMSFDRNHAPLSDISHLVVDEVHERDIHTDLCLTILKSVLGRNPNLKIILMSATNTPKLFVEFFQSEKLGIHPKVLNIPGQAFHVKTIWLNEIEKMIGTRLQGWEDESKSQSDGTCSISKACLSRRTFTAIDNSFVTRLVLHLLRSSTRHIDILIFLPGRAEIDSLARELLQADTGLATLLDVCKLHSTVSRKMQNAVFEPSDRSKIVLATNIAETSLTIPNIDIVIDTGRVKECRYNSHARIKELVTVWTSRASATQRAGRAGRTRPGTYYCLYTQEFAETHMLERTTPEILRTPLDEVVLQACLLNENRMDRLEQDLNSNRTQCGTAPVTLLRTTPDPPPIQNLVRACQDLIEIGAVQHISGTEESMRVKLTPLGYHLSQLPMDSKIGKILLMGCMLRCVEPSLTIAATLSSSRSIILRNSRAKCLCLELIESGFGGANWSGGTVKGDDIAVVAVYDRWCKESKGADRRTFANKYGLDLYALEEVSNLRKQFRSCLVDAGFLISKADVDCSHSGDALLTSCCLVAGLYPNVARLIRPVRAKLGIREGRLLTKDGDTCIPEFGSFQRKRVLEASETGRDVFAVYASKLQIIGPGMDKKTLSLQHINFIPRFALLLFGCGKLEVSDKFIIVDDWLKFKVAERGSNTAVLISEFRRELDIVLLKRLSGTSDPRETDILSMVIKLLQLG